MVSLLDGPIIERYISQETYTHTTDSLVFSKVELANYFFPGSLDSEGFDFPYAL